MAGRRSGIARDWKRGNEEQKENSSSMRLANYSAKRHVFLPELNNKE